MQNTISIYSVYEREHPNGDISKEFSAWFTNYVYEPKNCVVDEGLKHLAMGPKRLVKTYPIYFVNGYKFNTEGYGVEKLTNNTGYSLKAMTILKITLMIFMAF